MKEEIIFTQSEYERLLGEIHQLQARIAELTALRDDLVYHICPGLKAAYEEKIASLERELLAAQMYLREKQRIIEILQAQMNRQKKPSMDEAEAAAHEEFREYQEDIKRKAKEAEAFKEHWEKNTRWSEYDREEKRSEETRQQGKDKRGEDKKNEKSAAGDQKESAGAGQEKLGQQDDRDAYDGDQEKKEKQSPAEELKSLYRKIVKRLHPDVCPNATEHEKELLNKANNAYETGDLETMRWIWDELCGSDAPEEQFSDTPEGIQKLKEMLRKLKARLSVLEAEIRHIRSEFPYTMKSFLEDEAAVEAKRQQLSRQIDQTREMDRQLEEYIEQLRKQMNA